MSASQQSKQRVQVEIDGWSVTAELVPADGTFDLNVPGNANAPENLRGFNEAAKSLLGDGSEFKIHANRRVQMRRANLSYLRAAYLAAFAALGYRYILQPALAPIREQLRMPDESIIEVFAVGADGKGVVTNRRMVYVVEPFDFLLVQVAGRSIALPPIESAHDFYERLTQRSISHPREVLRGRPIAWPDRMKLALDVT